MSQIKKRLESDEVYVLDLIADIIGEAYEGQMRFDNLLGDTGKNGRRVKLPVDAFFPKANLIVEYREKQHSQSVSIMDKRMTISGVSRGEQRRIYDLRKEQWALNNEVNFLAISYFDLAHKKSGKLNRDPDYDRAALKRLLTSI